MRLLLLISLFTTVKEDTNTGMPGQKVFTAEARTYRNFFFIKTTGDSTTPKTLAGPFQSRDVASPLNSADFRTSCHRMHRCRTFCHRTSCRMGRLGQGLVQEREQQEWGQERGLEELV